MQRGSRRWWWSWCGAVAVLAVACSSGGGGGSPPVLGPDDQQVADAIAVAIDRGAYGLSADQERCIGARAVGALGAAAVKAAGLDTERPHPLAAADAARVADAVTRCADLREHVAFLATGSAFTADNARCVTEKVTTGDAHAWLVHAFEGTYDVPDSLAATLRKAVDTCNAKGLTASDADVVAAVRRAFSTDSWGFSDAETQCIATKLVSLLSVPRVRALQLDNINRQVIGTTEAGVVADVLFGCADMKAAVAYAYFGGQLDHARAKCAAAALGDDLARQVVIADLQGRADLDPALSSQLDARLPPRADACPK